MLRERPPHRRRYRRQLLEARIGGRAVQLLRARLQGGVGGDDEVGEGGVGLGGDEQAAGGGGEEGGGPVGGV